MTQVGRAICGLTYIMHIEAAKQRTEVVYKSSRKQAITPELSKNIRRPAFETHVEEEAIRLKDGTQIPIAQRHVHRMLELFVDAGRIPIKPRADTTQSVGERSVSTQ